MTDQLPAIIAPGALTVSSDTYIVPALIAQAGDAAGWRFVEFFTANINNDHTRRAYARASHGFFGGLRLRMTRGRWNASAFLGICGLLASIQRLRAGQSGFARFFRGLVRGASGGSGRDCRR